MSGRKELPFRVALVCASNQNRSMAAHRTLVDNGYNVSSYGTGAKVNLPGPTPTQPNIYEFGVLYQTMYDQLKGMDEALYSRNGVLQMLARNAKVKPAPERWQDEKSKTFDVAITYEERVFDAIIEDLEERGSKDYSSLHVLGLDVRDNHAEAEIGAQHTLQLLQAIAEAGDEWENELDNIIEKFRRKTGKEVTHNIAFY